MSININNFNNITDFRKYLIIQQLNDSLFPIGSYTQSYGLETYVQQGNVTNKDEFYLYLTQNLQHNFLYNELLAAKLGYSCAQENKIDQLLLLDEIISATKPAYEIRQAGIKLGSRLFKTIIKWGIEFENKCFLEYYQQVKAGNSQGHHALIYGVLCGCLNLQYEFSILNFAYAQLSGIINNGVKLIPLSQTVGQQLLYDLQPILIETVKKLDQLTTEELGRTAPGFELRSIQHEKLYSRLYMS